MMDARQLTSLLGCEDEVTWSDALFSIGQQLGFEQVLYGAVGSKHAKLETAFLQSSYPLEWREQYDAARLHYVDPTVTHCMGSAVPVVWAPRLFRTSGQRAMYEEACGYGLRSGITFPIHGPDGEFGVLSFASDALPGRQSDQQIARLMPALSLVRDYAFESSLRFVNPRDAPDPPPRLTRRELEVLKWVMVGKSSWEISQITRCAEATVNFHLNNVRGKFKVKTRQQALVKAISMGIIIPEDHHR